MQSLLATDIDGSPLPCTSWQEDFENQLPYFTGALKYRFRKMRGYERFDEQIQESLVQITILLERQYRQHGGRIDDRKQLVKRVVYWARVGRSSTRQRGHNADPMDYSGLARNRLVRKPYAILPETRPAPAEVSADTRIDLVDWLDGLPPRLREYAKLAYEGTPEETIRRTMGITQKRLTNLRGEIRRLWEAQSP